MQANQQPLEKHFSFQHSAFSLVSLKLTTFLRGKFE